MFASIAHDLTDPNTLWGKIIYAVIFFVIAFVAAQLVGHTGRKIASRSDLHFDLTALGFIRQLLQVCCFILAGIAYAHLIPALQHLGTAMLASAGVVSLVIGLAAQNTLGQLISGISLLLYRPFDIGDVLMFNGPNGKETATVKEFTLGYTKLLTDDGRWILVPNSIMASTILIRVK